MGFQYIGERQITDKREHIKVIYIMGYGRSGSTLLDILLGNAARVVTGGAMDNYLEWRRRGLPCACGLALSECSLWGRVGRQLGPLGRHEKAVQTRVEGFGGFILSLLGILPRRWRTDYSVFIGKLMAAVAGVGGGAVVVDSSKSTRECVGRPMALSSIPGLDVYVIFLVRDPRGVVWSAMKCAGSPERRRRFEARAWNFTRTLLSWCMTNILAMVSEARIGNERVLRLRYEDLCRHPEAAMNTIASFIDEDLSDVVRRIKEDRIVSDGHNLGGNRLRFQRNIAVRCDEEWRERMPTFYRCLAGILAAPLLKRLGYSA